MACICSLHYISIGQHCSMACIKALHKLSFFKLRKLLLCGCCYYYSHVIDDEINLITANQWWRRDLFTLWLKQKIVIQKTEIVARLRNTH